MNLPEEDKVKFTFLTRYAPYEIIVLTRYAADEFLFTDMSNSPYSWDSDKLGVYTNQLIKLIEMNSKQQENIDNVISIFREIESFGRAETIYNFIQANK